MADAAARSGVGETKIDVETFARRLEVLLASWKVGGSERRAGSAPRRGIEGVRGVYYICTFARASCMVLLPQLNPRIYAHPGVPRARTEWGGRAVVWH